MLDLLKAIVNNGLRAEVEISRTLEGLRAWLYETEEEGSRLRATRKELRNMVKENRKIYVA